MQSKHGPNSSSGDRLFLTAVPATVGCRVACAPRAHKQRRPHVTRERGRYLAYTPRTKYASAYWPAFASATCELGCLSPTTASGGRSSERRASKTTKAATGSQLPPPPLLLHRPPLHHLSRPGTITFEFVFYSAAAIKFDQLKSPGLSSCRSSFTTCITSNDTTMLASETAASLPQRLCCTAPALRFLATPKHGSISRSPHCCCSLPRLPHQA